MNGSSRRTLLRASALTVRCADGAVAITVARFAVSRRFRPALNTMTNREYGRKLAGMAARNVVPAYLAPVAVLSVVSRLILNEETGSALSRASFTTIAFPSALAALAVTIFVWWRFVRGEELPQSILWFAIFAASACAVLALAGSAVLVCNGYVTARLFVDAVQSSAIGGGNWSEAALSSMM